MKRDEEMNEEEKEREKERNKDVIIIFINNSRNEVCTLRGRSILENQNHFTKK
jgi:hypothetical protein